MADPDQYSEQEAQRRMESAIKRAHTLPRKPNSELTGKRRKSPKAKASKGKQK
jgi:hypothetical protein